ncbi:hypothetical protein B7H17_12085 [Pseudomonas putida]|uniref:Uncharacterized protein n=1 Tax=Pseudomonas putida TaxID=303 RepID=A0A1X0ZXJ6_PSEPU|nr:hypothetical protein B7H17_12085 [Pseudomonas putida]
MREDREIGRWLARQLGTLFPLAVCVGAALCRERAAKQPQGFGVAIDLAGAAIQPFRGTRPLLQAGVRLLGA